MRNMMLHRFLLFFLLLILRVPFSMANGTKIMGRLLYANDSTAVVGATVRLQSIDKNTTIGGTTTNEEGRFSLTNNTNKATRVEISFIGFIPISVQIDGGAGDISLGNMYLIEDSKVLDGVVITGALQQINRQMVFPDRLQIKASQDIMALLHNLSLNGLSVDQINKNATISGKPISWKINGVPRSVEEVRNLKPESILRIDYSDMPSMRELDKGYGGVIDIILKDRTDGGSVRTHLQSALWVGFINASASSDYHKGKSDISIDYNANYRNYPKWNKYMEQQFIGDDKTINRIEEAENSPFKYIEQYLNFTYIYQFSKEKLFSATWRNSLYNQSIDVRNNIFETGNNAFHRSSKSKYRDYTPALDLFFQNTFQNGGRLEANVVGTLSTGKNDRDLVDIIDGIEISSYSNPVNKRYWSLIGEVTYDKSIFRKTHLSIGFQNKYAYSSNEYLSPTDYSDKLRQNNSYLYGQISGRLNAKMQYSVGTGVKLFHVKGDNDSRTYFMNQSSIALYYSPAKELSLSLNSHFVPYLPALSQLSSVKQQFDDLSVYTGNNELKLSRGFSNRLRASYHKGKFNSDFSLHYNHTTDPFFTRVTYQPTEGYFLFQSDNGHYNKQYGAEWKANYKNIYNFLSVYGTIGVTRYESNVGDNPLHLNSFHWDLSAQMAYKELVLAVFYRKNGKSLKNETESDTGDNTGITLLWNKSKWTLYAQMMYVGHKNGDSYYTTNHSKVNPYTSIIKIPENANMLTLGFVWNVDYGKRKKNINRKLHNNDSNESVVKVQEY